jgi:uncharacterized ion transporter superfamily protein YfcC
MQNRAGAQIQTRAFVQSFLILLLFMLIAGMLTRILPAGSYTRTLEAGIEVVDPNSYQQISWPDYPVWRWFTAPVEVLVSEDAVVVITIILFILMVGGAFAVLDRSGILLAGIAGLVKRLGGRKYLLLLVVSLAFMALGAFFGIFEEVIPLIPVILALSYTLGWDTFVGLGMSILATNIGFSAAVTNPFTIGIAQQLAGLPLFSGAWLRLVIFVVFYVIFAWFLVRYARRVEKSPERSPVFHEERQEREKFQQMNLYQLADIQPDLRHAVIWFGVFLGLILAVLVSGPIFPAITEFTLPLVGVLFLIGGIGAGKLAGESWSGVFRAFGQGIGGIAPGILLILMAVSIKHIVVSGGVLDTILYSLSRPFEEASPFAAAGLIYVLALLIEVFIGSGSAKAFLMMPILLPLADLVGVTRQTTVLAYCFGDGFSNLMYPTNPVLLIALGLTVVSYPRWIRWSLGLWGMVVFISLIFLGIAVSIGYGPF